ncbi:MAG: cell division protein FtsK [Actinomycetia bacterium]|nr:cell division protein FtsK [Actinomycetes bacterium]
MAGRGKDVSTKVSSPSTPSMRPYATTAAELTRPHVAGESIAEKKTDTETWWWIAIAGLVAVGLLGYVHVWPAAQRILYQGSAVRDYLLPASASPVTVIAGVGVGWFWVVFIAAPASAALLGALWWAALSASNHRTRTGHAGHLRPGQQWVGHQYPSGALILAAAAVCLAGAGALLRWGAPAMTHLLGQLVAVALLGALAVGLWHFIRWALARRAITDQLNEITVLCSPALGWNDFRSGRVRALRCAYPRRGPAFPKVIKLLYSGHPLEVSEEFTAATAAVLAQVTGHTYTFDHDPHTRSLIGTETVIEHRDPVLDAEAVLAPLVWSWFDAAAGIISITVADPAAAGSAASAGEDATNNSGTEDPHEDSVRSAKTASDALAAGIAEFTVGFAYNLRVSSPYRRGAIEGMVADALGDSWEAQWSMASRRVRFVRSPGLPNLVYPPLDFPQVTRNKIRSLYKNAAIPFAIDAHNNIISWEFKKSPHMLISGMTSSGKTSALMTISAQCTRRGFNTVWIDPKGFDSPGLRDWPNVSLVTAGTDEDGLVGHAAALRLIADTMRERLEEVKINPNRADDFDPIIAITDEFSNLMVALAEFYQTYKLPREKGAPPTAKDVGILLRTARAVGIHLVIGIQRPDTMFIAGENRDNTALRVAMGRLRSKDAAIMMFNDPVAGTRVQPGIQGRGTVQLPDGSFTEIQAFYTPKIPATDQQWAALSDKERNILSQLREVDSFWPRRVVESALRGYDPENPEHEMSFSLIRQSPILLASERPDLDPLSDQYVRPTSTKKRPTMDDDHTDADQDSVDLVGSPAVGSQVSFGGPVDGFDDEYLPTTDDEYGPQVALTANEVGLGDLIDVSVDGVGDWKYVHGEPYRTEDGQGGDRLLIPYRDLEDGQNMADIDLDPYEVMPARKLHMN